MKARLTMLNASTRGLGSLLAGGISPCRAFCLFAAITLLALVPVSSFCSENPKFSDISKVLSNTGKAASFDLEHLLTNTNSSPAASSTSVLAASNSPPKQVLQTNSMDDLDAKHLLAIGDHLSFRIEEDRLLSAPDERAQDDTKQLFVTDTGEIDAPFVGRLRAEGKTCKELALEIKAALEKSYYKQATVILAIDLMTKSRGKVYLVGPVRAPGPQDIPSDEVLTLSRAILRAGGFTDFADRKNVKVTRKGSSVGEKKAYTVDVGQILDKGKTETDLVLEPEDLVYVPERMIRF